MLHLHKCGEVNIPLHEPNPLPEGWTAHYDSFKRIFYYNCVTGKSSWVTPIKPAYASISDTPETYEKSRQRHFVNKCMQLKNDGQISAEKAAGVSIAKIYNKSRKCQIDVSNFESFVLSELLKDNKVFDNSLRGFKKQVNNPPIPNEQHPVTNSFINWEEEKDNFEVENKEDKEDYEEEKQNSKGREKEESSLLKEKKPPNLSATGLKYALTFAEKLKKARIKAREEKQSCFGRSLKEEFILKSTKKSPSSSLNGSVESLGDSSKSRNEKQTKNGEHDISIAKEKESSFNKNKLSDKSDFTEEKNDHLTSSDIRKDFSIGQKISVRGMSGQIKYIGETDFGEGEWVGIDLDQPFGKHEGEINGVQYFECQKLHGLFVRLSSLITNKSNKLKESEKSKESTQVQPKIKVNNTKNNNVDDIECNINENEEKDKGLKVINESLTKNSLKNVPKYSVEQLLSEKGLLLQEIELQKKAYESLQSEMILTKGISTIPSQLLAAKEDENLTLKKEKQQLNNDMEIAVSLAEKLEVECYNLKQELARMFHTLQECNNEINAKEASIQTMQIEMLGLKNSNDKLKSHYENLIRETCGEKVEKKPNEPVSGEELMINSLKRERDETLSSWRETEYKYNSEKSKNDQLTVTISILQAEKVLSNKNENSFLNLSAENVLLHTQLTSLKEDYNLIREKLIKSEAISSRSLQDVKNIKVDSSNNKAEVLLLARKVRELQESLLEAHEDRLAALGVVETFNSNYRDKEATCKSILENVIKSLRGFYAKAKDASSDEFKVLHKSSSDKYLQDIKVLEDQNHILQTQLDFNSKELDINHKKDINEKRYLDNIKSKREGCMILIKFIKSCKKKRLHTYWSYWKKSDALSLAITSTWSIASIITSCNYFKNYCLLKRQRLLSRAFSKILQASIEQGTILYKSSAVGMINKHKSTQKLIWFIKVKLSKSLRKRFVFWKELLSERTREHNVQLMALLRESKKDNHELRRKVLNKLEEIYSQLSYEEILRLESLRKQILNVFGILSYKGHRMNSEWAFLPVFVMNYSRLMLERSKNRVLSLIPDEQHSEAILLCMHIPDMVSFLSEKDKLNSLFISLTDIVNDFGGDYLKLFGDYILCAWEISNSSTLQVIECAQSLMLTRNVNSIGISYSQCSHLYIGGFRNKFEYAVIGPAVVSCMDALQAAKKNEIVISDSFYSISKASLDCSKVPLSKLHSKTSFYVVNKVINEAVKTNTRKMALETVESLSDPEIIKNITFFKDSFLPRKLFKSLIENKGEAAIMRVSTLYIQLGDCEFERGEISENGRKGLSVYISEEGAIKSSLKWGSFVLQSLAIQRESLMEWKVADNNISAELESFGPSLQTTVLLMQMIICSKGGFLSNIIVDERGLILVVAFGIPQFTYTNNESRAISLALDICNAMHSSGFKIYIGLTTGDAFTSIIGNESRKEFVIMGEKVNFAAQLMKQSRILNESIICDEETFNQVSQDILFKKHDEPISQGLIYTPVGSSYLSNPLNRNKFKGRIEEIESFNNFFSKEGERESCTTIVVNGEKGAGKTAFLEYLGYLLNKKLNRKEQHVNLFICPGDVEHQHSAYYFFGDVIRMILGIKNGLASTLNQKNKQIQFLYALMHLPIKADIEEFLQDLDDSIASENSQLLLGDEKKLERSPSFNNKIKPVDNRSFFSKPFLRDKIKVSATQGSEKTLSSPGSMKNMYVDQNLEFDKSDTFYLDAKNKNFKNKKMNNIAVLDNSGDYMKKLKRFCSVLDFIIKSDTGLNAGKKENKLKVDIRTDKVQESIYLLLKSVEPCAIIIDDAQYIDEMSLIMLNRIIYYSKLKVTLIMSRNDSISLSHAASAFFLQLQKTKAFSISLKPLKINDITSILSSLYEVDEKDIPSSLIEELFKLTGGNPQFTLSSFVIYLKSKLINIDSTKKNVSLTPAWHEYVASEAPIKEIPVPPPIPTTPLPAAPTSYKDNKDPEIRKLKNLILTQFDQLSSALQGVLRSASSCGMVFPVGLISPMVNLGIKEAEACFDSLVEQEYFNVYSADEVKDRSILAVSSKLLFYEFSSSFVQSTIIENIPQSVLQKYYRKIARFYEMKFGDDMHNVFPLVAHYYFLASDYDKAFRCYQRAADRHYFDGNEALGLEMLLKALELVDNCTFDEYEGFKKNMLVEWYLVARDSLEKLNRTYEANKLNELALKLVHHNKKILMERKNLKNVDLTLLKEEKVNTKKFCIIS